MSALENSTESLDWQSNKLSLLLTSYLLTYYLLTKRRGQKTVVV